jgi:hypothetical protein
MAPNGNEPRRIQPGDIVPLGHFIDRARETLDVQRGAGATIRSAEVPPTLQHLIPLIERWAIAGSGPQIAFIESLRETAPAEIDAFCNALRPHLDEIREWNRQSLAVAPREAPDALVHFVYALGAYELAKPVDPDLIARNERTAELRRHAASRRDDIAASAEAFRARRFEEVVRLLSPHEAELTETELKRIEIARKHSS